MEQKHIKQKFDAGFISHAVIRRLTNETPAGQTRVFVIYFYDGRERIPLHTRRGGIRLFSELYSAANIVERIGLKEFKVVL